MGWLITFIKGYRYQTLYDLVLSFVPSLHLQITLKTISASVIVATLTELLGLKAITIVALIFALLLELGSGIYASLFIRKESFESGKFSRFLFKVLILLGLLFITNSFKLQYMGSGIKEAFFDWLNSFWIIYSFSEIVLSISENQAEIQGKAKDYYSNIIKEKLEQIFKLNQ